MNNEKPTFWTHFNEKDFEQAQELFDTLQAEKKQAILAELFQKGACKSKPFTISVLRRELHDDKNFEDFYKSWYPSKETCEEVKSGGQTYQQHFPIPVRVINGTNLNNPNEVISVGITWADDKEEQDNLLRYIARAKAGKDDKNQQRHEKIEKVADGELLGIFEVKTDDNLGTPF